MKRFSYGEQDYAFGQAMLTLRITIGLTQAGLAERLHVSRKAIGRWEAGSSYPKAEHLKALLAFAVGQQAFPAGREEEEVRAFWQIAHQKVSFDEPWLQGLLGTQRPRLALVAPRPVEQTHSAEHDSAPPAGGEPRVDWGDALDVPSFYGREGDLLASCGFDNTIQVWDLENGEHLRTLRRDRPYERLNITGIRGVTEAQQTTLRALGAIEDIPVNSTQHAP